MQIVREKDKEESFIIYVMGELEKCRGRMQTFEIRLNELSTYTEKNTISVDEIKSSTAELLDILNSCKGGLKVLGWLGSLLIWIGSIATAIVAIYSAYKFWK